MTKAEIIAKFHLFMDDTTELSTQEESDLFDKIYQQVMSDRPWEMCRKSFTGVMSTTVPYVALPDDFAFVSVNTNRTDDESIGERPVVFVGTNYQPYMIVNIGDRRQYRSYNNAAYIDIANNRLVFTMQPTAASAIEFDYIAVPANIDDDEEPIIPARFQDIIYHGMCVDEFIIEQSDKAKSYKSENQKRYDDYLASMALWNANLIQM